VLNELPLSVRSFLVMTSLLAQFNVRLAAHVTGLGEQECAQIVDYLRRANLFLISLDDLAYWYRYHHQFGDMLRHRLTLQCTAAEIEVLSSRAAAWLEDESLLDEALAQLAAGRQWPDACELIERHGYALLDRQAWPRLERWLSLLPAAWVQRRPVLLLFMAWICVPMVKPLERRRLLTGQAEALLGAEIAVEQRLFLQAQVFGLRSLYDSGVPLAQRAAAAEQALKGLGQRCGWITASVTYHRALQYCEQGELDAAVQLITSAIESWPPSSVTGYGILHYALLSLYYWQGTLADVESKARQLFQWFDAEQLPTQHAIACYYLAAVCAERGEFGEAKRLLLDILNPRRVALIGTRARALFLLFRIALFGGQDEITAHALDPFLPQDGRGQEGFSQGGDQPVLMQAGSACAALLTGDCAAALQWARAEVGEVKIGELARAQLPVLRAEILLAADRGSEGTAQALAILSPHTAYVRSIHLVGDTTQCAVLLALALWRSGSSLEALDALEEAVTLGFPRGYRWSFYRYGAEVADMLSALLQAGRSTHLVRGLLDAFPANCLPHATPEAAHAAARRQPLRPLLDHGVEPLTNREQEVLQLLARRLSNKQIAQMLCVSPATVRNHTANIYQKLAVPSRQVAVQRAQQLGLL
jgi:LuxR family maltose regulon positive regulatory protein